jgi:hypothetical protein
MLLLPPPADGEPPPRLSVLQAAYAARMLAQDVTGVCERHPEACATSRERLLLLTGGVDRGTLRPEDLEPAWQLPAAHN